MNGVIFPLYILDADYYLTTLPLLSDEHPSERILLLLLLFLIIWLKLALTLILRKINREYFLFIAGEDGVLIILQVFKMPNILRRFNTRSH